MLANESSQKAGFASRTPAQKLILTATEKVATAGEASAWPATNAIANAAIRNRRLNVGKGMDNAPSDEGDVGGNIQREPHSAMPNQDR